jgi:hypothetical protein
MKSDLIKNNKKDITLTLDEIALNEDDATLLTKTGNAGLSELEYLKKHCGSLKRIMCDVK